MKLVSIIAGISGSGKSTYAECLRKLNPMHTVVCTADDYFMEDGEYHFDMNQLGEAHETCKNKFMEALVDDSIQHIIVANTSTKKWEWAFYKTKAEDAGCMFTRIVVDHNVHNNDSVHDVPAFVIEQQKKNIINSLT